MASTTRPKPAEAQTAELKPQSAENKTQAETVDTGKKDSSVVIASAEKNEFIYYTVRKGDNFWSIAKKFPGVSNHEIMKLNNIKAANSLKVGQVLKIVPKA
jgi:membrane-bound lytic murein transglycosylase D